MTRSSVGVGLTAVIVAGLATSALATTIIRQDTRALVQGSSDIVVGRVASVRPHWDESHQHIVTDVDVDVSESFKGEKRRVTLTQLGGEVDGMRLTVDGSPAFSVGEEALLFVWRDARGVAQLNGLGQGKFEIQRDEATGERVLARGVPGLGFSDARTLRPMRAGAAAPRVSLARMLNEIQRALARGDR